MSAVGSSIRSSMSVVCDAMGAFRRSLVFCGVLAFCGCRHQQDDAIVPELLPCDTSAVTYSGSVVPILLSRCALPGCHVAGGNGTGDFTTYAGVFSQVQNGNMVPALQRTTGAIPMPPDGSRIPDCDIATIVAWVNAGAPNN